MNAAILLVTTAWFAGAEAAPATTAAPAATSAGTVISTHVPGAVGTGALGAGGCCGAQSGGCGCECDCCCKPSLLQRLRARMQRNNCCCETTCCGGGYGGNVGGCGGNVGGCGANVGCCGGNVGNCGCECDCCKPSLFQRLRARMQRNNCCCETSCCGGGYGYGTGVGGVGGVGLPGVMPGAEPIKPPKDATPGNKLPSSGKSGGTVQSHGLGLTPASSANLLETEKNPF